MDNSQKANAGSTVRLVMASQAGDRGAFDELVRLYQKRAMMVAVRILGSADEAAEAVQMGFLRAYLNIKKLRDAKQFEFWLLRIITNAAVTQVRALKRRAENIRIADCLEGPKIALPPEAQNSQELTAAVERAMLKLSKKEARAISLFGLKDLSQRQVAEIMNCSVEAVRWHVFNARKKLRVLLREYLE
ncbi:MAG TPA: RNA polymerase sigma factor [Sedimentisphaerales bacterium]|nr:RNA polymerase sigma factor [Sedimentisphaerales bacterium]